jgi:hypothetical protein
MVNIQRLLTYVSCPEGFNRYIAASARSDALDMQQKLIGSLQFVVFSSTTNPSINYLSMLGVSDSSRVDSIVTLAEQYQRFSAAAPISRGLDVQPVNANLRRRC